MQQYYKIYYKKKDQKITIMSGAPGRSPNHSHNHPYHHNHHRNSRRSIQTAILGIDTSAIVTGTGSGDASSNTNGNNGNNGHHSNTHLHFPPSTTSTTTNNRSSLDFNFDLYDSHFEDEHRGPEVASVPLPVQTLIGISPRDSVSSTTTPHAITSNYNNNSTSSSFRHQLHQYHPRTSVGSTGTSTSMNTNATSNSGRRRTTNKLLRGGTIMMQPKNPGSVAGRGRNYPRSSMGSNPNHHSDIMEDDDNDDDDDNDVVINNNAHGTTIQCDNGNNEEDGDDQEFKNEFQEDNEELDEDEIGGVLATGIPPPKESKFKTSSSKSSKLLNEEKKKKTKITRKNNTKTKKTTTGVQKSVLQTNYNHDHEYTNHVNDKSPTNANENDAYDPNDPSNDADSTAEEQKSFTSTQAPSPSLHPQVVAQASKPMSLSSIQKLRNLAQTTLMMSSTTFSSTQHKSSIPFQTSAHSSGSGGGGGSSSASFLPQSSSFYSTNTSSTAVFYTSILYTKTQSISDAYLYAKALCYNDEYKRAIGILDNAGLLNFYTALDFDTMDDTIHDENHNYLLHGRVGVDVSSNNAIKGNFVDSNVACGGCDSHTENVAQNNHENGDLLMNEDNDDNEEGVGIGEVEVERNGNIGEYQQKKRKETGMFVTINDHNASNNRTTRQSQVQLQQLKQKQRVKLVMESVILACYCWSYLGEWEQVGSLLEHFILNNPIVHQFNHDYNYHDTSNHHQYIVNAYDGSNEFIKSIYWRGDYDIEDEEVFCRLAHYIYDLIDHDNDINPVSRLCFLRGRACDEGNNPHRAVTFLKLALWIDVKCIEAWQYLCKRCLLTWEQEREVVYSLRFDCAGDGVDWLKDVYLASMASSESVSSAAITNNNHQQHPRRHHQPFQSGVAEFTPMANSVAGASPIMPVLPEQPTPQLQIDASAIKFAPTPTTTTGHFHFNEDKGGMNNLDHNKRSDDGSQFNLKPSPINYSHLLTDYGAPMNNAIREEEEAFQNLNLKHNLSNSPEMLAIAATRAYKSYNLPLALHYCHILYEIDPLCSKAAHIQIATLTGLGHKRPLFRLAHALVDADPKSAMAWYAVGCYYYSCGRFDVAQRHYSRSIRLDDRIAECWVAYGCAFASCDENDQANTCFRHAQRLYSGSHYPMLYMGMEHLRTNNIPLAGHFLNSARNMGKNDPLCCNELGVWAYRKKEWVEAANWFVLALRLYVEYEVVGKRLSSWGKSFIEMESNTENDPRFEFVNQSPGEHISAGLSDSDCIDFCEEAFWEPTIFNLGQSYRKARRFEDATMCFEKCLALSPVCKQLCLCFVATFKQTGISQQD